MGLAVIASDGSGRAAKIFGSNFRVGDSPTRAEVIMYDSVEDAQNGAGGKYEFIGCTGLTKENAESEAAIAAAIQAYADGDFAEGGLVTL